VHAWKERGLRRGADLAAQLVAAHVEPPPADVIAYIPPDGDRLLRRGYHPPEQLADRLAACWGLPALPLLGRTRPVDPQVGLTLAERRRNVHDAFAARARVPPTVLLVDDVYTTGSTVSAAAGALRRAGAERVDVVTFARTVR
jgi:predicted amidophosphoribosyltransferase